MPGQWQSPANRPMDISDQLGMPGHQLPGMPGHRPSLTGHSPTTGQVGDIETSSLPITGHRPSSHRSLDLERLNLAEIQESLTSGHDRSPGSRPPVTGHQNIIQPSTSESHTFGTEFTSKQSSTSRILLPLEPDFGNISDPSVVIEPPCHNWRSDNNNDNYRQIHQTSLSGRRSRRDQSRDKHRSKKRRRWRSASTSSSSTYTSSDSRKRKSKRSKHSHKKRKRRYTSLSSSSSSSVSHNHVHDYGRYQRSRYSPQAVQNPQSLQPEEIPNVQTMTPEQTSPRPSRDSGFDTEMETWSFDRAINKVFRLLPQDLCPRPTEEHAPAKPLSGIEQLMESQSTPLMILPQSRLIENTT